MMMVQVSVDLSHLKLDQMPQVAKRATNLTAQDLVGTLMKHSPVKHGLLKQWFIAEHSDLMYKIKSPAKSTAAQNWGSTHFIAPKSKKALHWGGKPGYFSKGHTITIHGKHFVEDSISEVKPRIDDHFKVAISEVLG
jgi:hypothetical protein